LSFTADEIWQTLGLDAEATVFEDYWYDLPAHGLSAERVQDWEMLLEVRGVANKAIEEKRGEGSLGSSLQSELDVYAQADTYRVLKSFGDDLRFLLIASRATMHEATGAGLRIAVSASPHPKCDRCWHYREDVGADAEHPSICGRCVSNLFAKGEARHHA
jgi:isoleucyl-tRNA synthetase